MKPEIFTTFDEDGLITGIAHLDPDYIDMDKHISGAYDGDNFYVDIADKSVKPNNDNPAVISHTGQVTQGTVVQITSIAPKSKVDISTIGQVVVDDGVLDINTAQALGEVTIRIRSPQYKPREWAIEVVAE